MARISDILEIEKQRTEREQWNVIHLFKEGGFYRAYEWSAWLIVTMAYTDEVRQQTGDRKPLNVTHKRSRNSDDTFLFVGFPLKSADKFIPQRTSFDSVSDTQLNITISLAWNEEQSYETLDEAFQKWKSEQPIQEPKQKREDMPADTGSRQHSTLTGIMSEILAWPLEQKTLIENTAYLSAIKQRLAQLI
jgi:hypothetical protein